MRIRCFWVSLAICLSAQVAFAQEGPAPKLFMLPTQGVQDSVSTIVPERIGEMLREKVGADARVELMPDYDTVRKELGGSGHSSAAVADAEKLYNSGIGHLTAGNDKEAVTAFSRAVEIMENNLGDVSNFDILADALANLALAYFNAGFDLDARKKIQQYAHMRPDATLDTEKFPKALIKIHTAEVKKVKAAGPGTLTVTSQTEAFVTIDGVDKGKTPATINDVGFGHHYLVVSDGQGGVYGEKIRVRGKKKKQKFGATLQPSGSNTKTDDALPPFYVDLNEKLRSGKFDTEISAYLSELANQTGANFISWVLMYRSGAEYISASFVYRASDNIIVQIDDVKFNIELSNLVVGVNTLAGNLVDTALAMPEDKAIASVELVTPATGVVVNNNGNGTSGNGNGTVGDPNNSGEISIITPPPSTRTSTWTYIGIAAGGIAAIGLVAGGIYLLSKNSGGSGAPGFNAEVAW